MNEDIKDVLRKLVPIIGEEAVRRAWESLQLADAKTAKLIEFSLRRKLAEATGSYDGRGILLDPIPADRASGSIHLGQVVYADKPMHPFGLRKSELIQHLALFGRSGAGKSNTCFLLLHELSRLGVPFLVLDWKSQYRDLMNVPGFEKLVVYTVGRETAPFFFNPLIPPRGTAPKEWLKKLVQIMQHAYFLGAGVAFVLQEVLDGIYQDFGVYDQVPDRWPTLRDVLTRLRERNVKGREAGWADSALRGLGVLNFGSMDAVFNSGIPLPMERLLKQQAVLELEGLVEDDKVFLMEALLLWIHHYRMYETRREELKHLLLIEEAHHILNKRKQEITGAEAVTDVLLREVREYGQAIAVVDQLPQLISKPAIANSFCTIAMNLKENGDVVAAAKAMLLDTEQKTYLGHLPVGTAIVKLQGRWTHPFLVSFPQFAIRKGSVTDAQVSARWIEAIDAPTYFRMFAREFMQFAELFKEVVIPRLSEAQPSSEAFSPAKPQEPGPVLTTEQEHLLRDVAALPASTITERYARLELKAEHGTSLVKDLVDLGYLRESTLTVGTRHIRLLSLTPMARTDLGLPPEQDRLGGPEHRFWAEVIAGALRVRSLPVLAEAPIGDGQAIDLVTNVNGDRIAIEVETGKSDWRANIEKCLKHATKVILAVTNDEAFERIRAAARDFADAQRIRILRPEDLVSWIESGRFPADSADSSGF